MNERISYTGLLVLSHVLKPIYRSGAKDNLERDDHRRYAKESKQHSGDSLSLIRCAGAV